MPFRATTQLAILCAGFDALIPPSRPAYTVGPDAEVSEKLVAHLKNHFLRS